MCYDYCRDRERIYLSANRGKRHKAKIETASKVARMAIRGVRFAADRGLTPWACKPREVSCAAKALLELNNPLNLIDVHVHCRPQVQVETLPQMTVVYVRSQADH
jgi:hypothetical protein